VTTVLVIDASVLLVALTDLHEGGKQARSRLRGEKLYAPSVIDLEVASALRRLVASKGLGLPEATAAVMDLAVLPVERVPHQQLLERCWEVRSNLTPYDAAYVALAEVLEAPLITADRRLAGAPGLRCRVEVLGG
jgi:predicted nucleic acid-binding protein